MWGTETEYGILAPGRPDLGPEELSALVVDACGVPALPPTGDAHHRTLGNGARLYVDHAHPEYATPEATTPGDLVVAELAGDRIVARAAAAASAQVGSPVRVYRNNTDGKGSSYGHHENVLLRRSTPWALVEAALPALLVSRTLLAGAGRVGLGTHSGTAGFQLSQRADFFERVVGLATTRRRGIVNTRDEPLARPGEWRRLHVITGDATRSPFASWLKAGSLGLCLAALEAGLLPVVRLADPVAAFRTVSRDLSFTAVLPLADGRTDTASGLQRRFLDAAGEFARRWPFPEADAVLAAWAQVLDDLATDPSRLADRLDWAAKLALLEAYRTRDALAWDAPRLAALDLAWADLASGGVVDALTAAGRLRPGPPDADVEAATRTPPPGTRAGVRGAWVTHHPDAVLAASWESLLIRDPQGRLHTLDLGDPFHPAAAAPDGRAGLATLLDAHEHRQGGPR